MVNLSLGANKIEYSSAMPVIILYYNSIYLNDMKIALNKLNDMSEIAKIHMARQKVITTIDGQSVFEGDYNGMVEAPVKAKKSQASPSWIDYRNIPYDNYVANEYSGYEVKIGIADMGYFDLNHSNFQGTSVSLYSSFQKNPSDPGRHAMEVCSILGEKYGIAPRAELHIVDANDHRYVGYRYLDFFVEIGMDIISLSIGSGDNGGQEQDPYFDYIVYNYGVFIIGEGGNGWGAVMQPGSAANVINVNSIDPSYIMGAGAYINVNGVISKPNLVAMGNARYISGFGYRDGTSYAVPAVAGTVALMMEKNPQLKGNPALVMSVLANAANNQVVKKGSRTDIDDSFEQNRGMNKWSGAGALDISKSLWLCGTVNPTNMNFSSFNNYYLFSVDNVNAGNTLYIVHAWLRKSQYKNGQYTQSSISDFDIRIYDSNNICIARTTSVSANVEKLQYKFTASGNYTVRVMTYNVNVNKYGVSCVRFA